MCSKPITANGVTFACRNCNECIATRRASWVARACAEKNTSTKTFALHLTYNNETEHNRDGSVSFQYNDVRLFMVRLRRQIKKRTGKAGQVRFIACGENGALKGRVHWHLILFTQVDLFEYGDWDDFDTSKPIAKDENKLDIRITWSLWPHGLVEFQEPNQGGISYVLKYALKDQFNQVKSQGTAREGKSELWTSSYFRMSKSPPIGALWLQNKLEALRAKGAVPTSLNLTIPEYSGYWYPSGSLREYMLEHIYETNQLHIKQHGKPCPQFSTLLASVVSLEKETERLKHGISQDEEAAEEANYTINENARKRHRETEVSETTRRCGGILPCTACQRGTTAEQFQKLKNHTQEAYGNDPLNENRHQGSDEDFRREGKINPFCKRKDEPQIKQCFKK